MQKKDLEKMMQKWFIDNFNHIYDKIIYTAIQGKTKYIFDIRKLNDMCERYYHLMKFPDIQFPDDVILFPGIQSADVEFTEYKTKLIESLHTTFVDSNITLVNKNKNNCEQYVVEW